MARFFKNLLLIVLGTIVSTGILVLIFMAVLAGVMSGDDKKVEIDENTLLTVNLNKVIVDRGIDNPLKDFFGDDSPFIDNEVGLNNILKNIKKAKNDDRILGIYLESGMPQTGYATLNEIRNALIDFKESGKFIIAFSPIYSQKGYYLTSVASKAYMPPQGMIEFKGISAQRTFFKGSLEKLGVEMQIFKHGKYKSAVEPFILEEMSESAKEQTIAYTSSIWDYVVSGISESREIPKDSLNSIVNKALMFKDNQSLIKYNLLDGLKYKDEVIAEIKTLTNTKEKDDIEQVNLSQYAKVYVPKETTGLVKEKIAVIYASGEIDGGSDDGINSEDLSKTIRKARRDKNIKAVVLRINSPGGSGMGSDVIWREVSLCKKEKPVIVSMGNVAASGGYYIACEADTIVANPTTITGSIGVFGMMPNAQKFLNKKLGVTFDGVKTNKYADFPNITRPFTNDEKALFQNYVENFYGVFLTRCAEGRNTTTEEIDKVGEGRVWSGTNAKNIKLVDVLGGLNTAIEIAKEKAELADYRIKEMPEQLSPFEEIFKGMKSEAKSFISETFLGINYDEVKQINKIKEIKPLQARLPYDIHLN